MILTIKVIIIIGTLHNGWKPLSNIKKSSPSDAARALYMPLKRFVYHVTWWIGVDDAPSIPCLELSPTRFLKNNCNGNVNQNNNYNNNYNNHNSGSKTITIIIIIMIITIIIIIIIIVIIQLLDLNK